MPSFSSWHFLAAAIISSQVAGGVSPIRSLRQISAHVSPSSGRPYVFASGSASPVWDCGYWPYAARKYGSYCDVSTFSLTKSVMSTIDPLVDRLTDVLGVQNRHVEVGLARRELGEDRVVPLRVRHGVDLDGDVRTRLRVLLAELLQRLRRRPLEPQERQRPSARLKACWWHPSPPGRHRSLPPSSSPPQATTPSDRANAASAAETASLPFIAPPPRGLVLLR